MKDTKENKSRYSEAIISLVADDNNNETMLEHQSIKRSCSFIKGNRKNFTGVQSFQENGKTIKDSKKMADVLNRQFESVFQHED